jgi:hypothetical protein
MRMASPFKTIRAAFEIVGIATMIAWALGIGAGGGIVGILVAAANDQPWPVVVLGGIFTAVVAGVITLWVGAAWVVRMQRGPRLFLDEPRYRRPSRFFVHQVSQDFPGQHYTGGTVPSTGDVRSVTATGPEPARERYIFAYAPCANRPRVGYPAAHDLDATLTVFDVVGNLISGPFAGRWADSTSTLAQDWLDPMVTYDRLDQLPANKSHWIDLVFKYTDDNACHIFTNESAREGTTRPQSTKIPDREFVIVVEVHASDARPVTEKYRVSHSGPGTEIAVERESS